MITQMKRLIKYPNYIKEVLGSAFSRFGDGIDTIAFSILVYRITGSTMLMASLFAVNGLPNIIFGLLSGVISTHGDEKKITAICDFGRFACVLCAGILFAAGQLQVWHLYIITFCNSSFEAFRAPAATSLLPRLLDEEVLNDGIAVKASLEKTFEVIGLASATVIISLGGLHTALLIDSLTFFVCALCMLSIKLPKIVKEKVDIKSGLSEAVDGFKYLKINSMARFVCCFTCIINIVFVPINVFPVPYIEVELKGTDAMLSVIGVTASLAMAFSASFMPSVQKKLGNGRSMQCGGSLIVLSFLILSVLQYFITMVQYAGLVVSMLLLGCGITLCNYILQSIFYEMIEPEYYARMGAVTSTIALCALPIASSILGVVLNSVSISLLFGVFAIVSLVVFGFSGRIDKHNIVDQKN